MADNNVLRVNPVEEETLYLEAVHRVIACILAAKAGRTLIDVADSIGVDKKTISNAFNKTHRLSQVFLTRLGKVFGVHCLDPVAALMGGRMIPLEADENDDALPTTTAAIHKLAIAKSTNSPGGERITHCELLAMEGDIDAAIRSLTSLKLKCSLVRSAAA